MEKVDNDKIKDLTFKWMGKQMFHFKFYLGTCFKIYLANMNIVTTSLTSYIALRVWTYKGMDKKVCSAWNCFGNICQSALRQQTIQMFCKFFFCFPRINIQYE